VVIASLPNNDDHSTIWNAASQGIESRPVTCDNTFGKVNGIGSIWKAKSIVLQALRLGELPSINNSFWWIKKIKVLKIRSPTNYSFALLTDTSFLSICFSLFLSFFLFRAIWNLMRTAYCSSNAIQHLSELTSSFCFWNKIILQLLRKLS
jgi:hypothetical protein